MATNIVAGVDLSTIKKIVISSACLESYPCKHSFTLIGKDDSTIEKDAGAIHDVVKKAKELGIEIEPNNILSHFENMIKYLDEGEDEDCLSLFWEEEHEGCSHK